LGYLPEQEEESIAFHVLALKGGIAMESVILWCCAWLFIIGFCKSLREHCKKKEEARLLERNPEAWRQVKELELDKNDRKRRAAGGLAVGILTALLKK
jgi:hypothetical protein